MTAVDSPSIPPLLPPAPPVFVPPAPISEDLHCIRCQYNLRTRTPADMCPECGTPVAQSVAHYRDHAKAIVLPVQLAGAAYILAVAMLGGILCFAGVYGMKLYADSSGSPAALLSAIRAFNYLSHLAFVITATAAAFLLGGAVGHKILADGLRPILSIFLVGFSLVAAVTVLLVFSLPGAAMAARFRGFRGPVFAIIESIKMGDFVGACMYVLLVLVGYGVMRNVANVVAEAGFRRMTAVAFGLALADALLGAGVYGWMVTWSPRVMSREHEGFIFAADLFSMVISAGFGVYWLLVARTVRGRMGSVVKESAEAEEGGVPAAAPKEKVSRFLGKRAGEGNG